MRGSQNGSRGFPSFTSSARTKSCGMMSGGSGLPCAAATASRTQPCRATVMSRPAKFRRGPRRMASRAIVYWSGSVTMPSLSTPACLTAAITLTTSP